MTNKFYLISFEVDCNLRENITFSSKSLKKRLSGTEEYLEIKNS